MIGLALIAATPELFRLASGVPVVVESVPSAQTVSIQAVFRIDDLSPIERGVLNVVLAAMTVETESFSTPYLQGLAWFVGGELDAEAGTTHLRLGLSTDKSHLAPSISLLADALKRTAISPDALQRASRLVKVYSGSDSHDPSAWAIRRFAAELGVGPADVSQITDDAAFAVYVKVFRPERAAIGVAGPIRPQDVARQIAARFGDWKPPPPPKFNVPAKGIQVPPESPFNILMAGIQGPGLSDQAFPAWTVLLSAIGLGKGSLLGEAFRNTNGLAYRTGLEIAAGRSKSTAIVYVVLTKTQAVEQRLATLRNCVHAAASLVASDVHRAKEFLIGRYTAGSGTLRHELVPLLSGHVGPRARAFHLAWWEAVGGGYRYDSTFSKLVKEVTPEQVENAARKWLDSATFKLQ